jgi:hypothetical protein
MTQRISLNHADFKKLVRGEIVTQGELQAVLLGTDHQQFEHCLPLEEGERQMLVLALAELALSRPGWNDCLQRIAQRVENEGAPMYERFKRSSADRVRAERGPLVPQQIILEQDTEEVRRWIHGINQGEPCEPGQFLYEFARFVCRADCDNYPILRPALLILMQKYPKYRFEGAI